MASSIRQDAGDAAVTAATEAALDGALSVHYS